MSNILNIAVSGLNAATARISNAASNIVNASSDSPVPPTPSQYNGFTPQDIVSLSVNVSNGASEGVSTAAVPRNPAYNVAYDPSSSVANANGFVAVPNVDIASELVGTVASSAAYGASAKVVEVAQKLDQTLLDITT